MERRPEGIHDYALIGDSRSAALVSRSGSIDWLCWPRFDSPSLFAAILDPGRGGRWRIAPPGEFSVARSYVGHSPVLATRFKTDTGDLVLTDWMPVASPAEHLVRLMPEREILRVAECVDGEVEVEMTFQPRPGYGGAARLRDAGSLGHRLDLREGLCTLRSSATVTMEEPGVAVARTRLGRGESLAASLSFDAEGPAVLPLLGDRAADALRASVAWWEEWARRSRYDGPYRDAVVRSALTLKLLSYAPSGTFVAAPTTSLPERVGGKLNWDYRYSWIRDSAFTVRSLHGLGHMDEARAFVSWLLYSTRLTQPRVLILYDVHGLDPGGERTLDLAGYRGSRPVREGNAAARQLQLDAYGEIVDAVTKLLRREGRLDRETRSMFRRFASFVCQNWRRPDNGIWEMRGECQEHTHSRALCCVALTRLLELEEKGELPGLPTEELRAACRDIREDIAARGWNAEIRSYTQTLGGSIVDSSLLLLPWYGFEDASNPRMRDTAARICERLEAAPGLLYRYEQSRERGEGAFLACTFWMAEFLALGGGSASEARDWIEAGLRCANDVGLFSEEVDPSSGEALGNFPQGLTHIGLISAVLALREREEHDRAGGRQGAR